MEEQQQINIMRPDLSVSFEFMTVCRNGHLEVAKWLLEVKPDINISAYNDYAFRCACEYGHLELAQWLADEVKPERYEITEVTTDVTGKYNIKYKIYPDNDRPVYVLK